MARFYGIILITYLKLIYLATNPLEATFDCSRCSSNDRVCRQKCTSTKTYIAERKVRVNWVKWKESGMRTEKSINPLFSKAPPIIPWTTTKFQKQKSVTTTTYTTPTTLGTKKFSKAPPWLSTKFEYKTDNIVTTPETRLTEKVKWVTSGGSSIINTKNTRTIIRIKDQTNQKYIIWILVGIIGTILSVSLVFAVYRMVKRKPNRVTFSEQTYVNRPSTYNV